MVYWKLQLGLQSTSKSQHCSILFSYYAQSPLINDFFNQIATSDSRSYPIALQRLGGPCSRPNPRKKSRESNR